ncbi:hypothetical protein Calkro_0776 [Caldicellulosiruptor kronotskyensis 2002]|uniref:Uncharacterized protein n=1 Tax=Caldicellulosiruptor kronotskyensis (strain DSM 18902 / VKM B-2412 / 2002) TaxID=632348 RepID=E4SB03_CALK2|nr:hypothetical protein [Caldicellulosiruptor kronotskyensis]ADQ45658.1 hypothetical protein Calkro_0776 [Caldicellulosiruptor kronotskyensis 2002]
MKIKNIFISWDFIISVLVAIIMFFIFPWRINGLFAKDIFAGALTVLSVVFSIYLAALAIIISSSDNEFIEFLEKEKMYSSIIDTFKVTLVVTFFSLVLTSILYGITAYFSIQSSSGYYINKLVLIIFIFFFFYSLLSVFVSALDSVTYFKMRTRFIRIKFRKKLKIKLRPLKKFKIH